MVTVITIFNFGLHLQLEIIRCLIIVVHLAIVFQAGFSSDCGLAAVWTAVVFTDPTFPKGHDCWSLIPKMSSKMVVNCKLIINVRGTPFPCLGGSGGTPFQVQAGGYPLPRSRWGTPIQGLDGGGGYPQGIPPSAGWVPPIHTWEGGTPHWTWEGGTPHPDQGRRYTPPGPGKGVPPCPDLGRGYPPRSGPRMGGIPNRNNIACTWYARAVCLLRSRRRTFLYLEHSQLRIYVLFSKKIAYHQQFQFRIPMILSSPNHHVCWLLFTFSNSMKC